VGSRVIVGSTVGLVIAGLETRPTIDRAFLVRFLRNRHTPLADDTAYEGIRWVPAGHRLMADRDRTVIERHSTLSGQDPPPRTAAEAQEQFRALLTSAVERRLRSASPVAIRLSGGFDSASITCLANDAVQQGRCSAPLRAYSAVFHANARADEREYVDSVLDKSPHVVARRLPWDDRGWSLDDFLESNGPPPDEPDPTARFFIPLHQIAVDEGCRVILDGSWADQLVRRWPYGDSRLLWDLPLAIALRELRHFWTTKPANLIKSVPGGIWRVSGRMLSRAGLASRRPTAVAHALGRRIVGGADAAILNRRSNLSRSIGAEFRQPYLDRALHEFVMTLPPQFLFGGGEVKRLQRRALKDVLPAAFQTRTSFGALTTVIHGGMCREAGRIRALLTSSTSVELGLISQPALDQLLSSVGPAMPGQTLVRVQRLIALDVWLRSHNQTSWAGSAP